MCLDSMDNDKENLVITSCNHTFHRACLNEWTKIQNTCPLCRNIFSALHEAAKSGNLATVKTLLVTPDVTINAPDNDGNTPLHLATYTGHTEIVEFLIKFGADVCAKNKHGDTPLDIATQVGCTDIVEILQEVLNPLFEAAKSGDLATIKTLLATPDVNNVNATSRGGLTALHHASINDHIEVVEFLVRNGADVNATDNDGNTSLHLATRRDYKKVVTSLIKFGADVNIANHGGYTPLHLVAYNNRHSQTAKFLIEQAANIMAKSNDGYTPLDIATQMGCTDIVKILQNSVADGREVSSGKEEKTVSASEHPAEHHAPQPHGWGAYLKSFI